MGEDKALICRDCEAFTEVDKLPFKGWEDMSREEWFDNEYRCKVAFKLMGFLSEHRDCNVSLVGEYGVYQNQFFNATVNWDEEYDIF
jgi:hypothetical protein